MTGQIANLPTSGRFIVDTVLDVYDVDLDARVVVYVDLAREANGRHVSPMLFFFNTVDCAVGAPMTFDNGSRSTSRVVGITPAPVEVKA